MGNFKSFLFTINRRGLKTALQASFREISGSFYKLFRKRFVKRKIYNYQMYLDLKDIGLSRALWLFGNRELDHKYMLETIVKPGMSILDIGANIGYYPLMELKLIGKKGNLIAIEPSSSNIALLKKNLTLNGFNNVEIHEGAISDKNATKEIFISTQSNLNTFHNIGTSAKHLSGKTEVVKTYTIAKILNGRKTHLIRMDVEGHEVEILNGLVSNISEINELPMIIFETHISKYNENHDFKKTLKNIFDIGYGVTLVGSSSENGSNIIKKFGYKPIKTIKSDGNTIKIFKNIRNEDAIEMICKTGGIRTVLLRPTSNN